MQVGQATWRVASPAVCIPGNRGGENGGVGQVRSSVHACAGAASVDDEDKRVGGGCFWPRHARLWHGCGQCTMVAVVCPTSSVTVATAARTTRKTWYGNVINNIEQDCGTRHLVAPILFCIACRGHGRCRLVRVQCNWCSHPFVVLGITEPFCITTYLSCALLSSSTSLALNLGTLAARGIQHKLKRSSTCCHPQAPHPQARHTAARHSPVKMCPWRHGVAPPPSLL